MHQVRFLMPLMKGALGTWTAKGMGLRLDTRPEHSLDLFGEDEVLDGHASRQDLGPLPAEVGLDLGGKIAGAQSSSGLLGVVGPDRPMITLFSILKGSSCGVSVCLLSVHTQTGGRITPSFWVPAL